MGIKRYAIIFFLLFSFNAQCDEILDEIETQEDVTVVNEELRQLRKETESNDLWEEEDAIQLQTAQDIDFQQKEAKSFVIENRTDDPSSPVAGQIWIRTDL